MTQIFISYRRQDTQWVAGRLGDYLASHFGPEAVFMDVDMDPGIDWGERIEEAVSSCDVLLALIGSDWVDSRDASGRRRLEDPEDKVALEIATALARGIRVIPVLVNNGRLPSADDLPERLRSLTRRQAVDISHDSFRSDASKLVRGVERALAEHHPQSQRAAGATPIAPPRAGSAPGIGSTLGPYHLEALIGRGGTGSVYRATDVRLQRSVALKVVAAAAALGAGDDLRSRFERESQLAAAFEHPNVIPIYDVGEASGLLYVAMRYVPTLDLRALIEREGHLDLPRAVHILLQLSSALDAGHSRGLVHGDVKPGNVLVDTHSGDHVYLTDFGLAHIARRNQSEDAAGTLDYMAPELLANDVGDTRADVYALGCTLFVSLTGRPPFAGADRVSVMYAHLQARVPKPSAVVDTIPPAVDAVVEVAMAKDPAQRYSSAAQFADALLRATEPVRRSATAVPPPVDSSANVPSEPAHALDELAIGDELGGYLLERVLRDDGTTRIFEARHIQSRVEAAIRVQLPSAGNPDSRRRFVQAQEIVKTLVHPNIIPLFTTGEDRGLPFIATQRFPELTLSQLIDDTGRLTAERAIRLLSQIASALDAIHAQGIIMRSFTPDDIFIEENHEQLGERVYLSNFDLAEPPKPNEFEITRPGVFIGEAAYAAPELITGHDIVDHRADVYALGVLLYVMMTGVLPYPEASVAATLFAHLHDPVPSVRAIVPDAPAALDPVIASATAKTPNLRYRSAGALANAAARAISSAGAAERTPSGDVLPRVVGFFAALAAPDLDARSIAESWTAARREVRARVGMSSNGAVELDLRRDGPHVLVAGWSGSGKSVFLETLILSLAISYPPTRVSFLLCDAAAALRAYAELPHTVAQVGTSRSERRNLIRWIRREVEMREKLLATFHARDLVALERDASSEAPPVLVVVIDEWSTFAHDDPEWTATVADVAARGRSLGIHLVVATVGMPATLGSGLRAALRTRVVFRVADESWSNDLLGAPDAALIDPEHPGRAYLRLGEGEILELQVATPRRHPSASSPEDSERTDTLFRAVFRSLGEAAATAPEAKRLVPWRRPLPERVILATAPAAASGTVGIGLVDWTDFSEGPLSLDLEQNGSILIYGGQGAGKTTCLRTVALALAESLSPAELNIYAIDVASRGLRDLNLLPHVGGVLERSDVERVAALFRFLSRRVARRREQFAPVEASSLAEFRVRDPAADAPRIVVLIDDYSSLQSAFDIAGEREFVETVTALLVDGAVFGVHFIVTANRRGALPSALSTLFSDTLILRMTPEEELNALGVPPERLHDVPRLPGRGLRGDGMEFQLAYPEGYERRARVLRDTFARQEAPRVRTLPERVERSELPTTPEPWSAAIGLTDVELTAATISLSNRHFLVTGPYLSGRSTALRTLVEGLRNSTPGLQLYLLAPRPSPLESLDGWTTVARGSECGAAADWLIALTEPTNDRPALLVVDDGESGELENVAGHIEHVVRAGRDRAVRLVAAVESDAATRFFTGWVREIRKYGQGLLLNSKMPYADGQQIFHVNLPRRLPAVVSHPGRGYLIARDDAVLVQVAT